MAPQMAATLWRGVIFSRLPRPHPRVLGTSVCASTRCFLAAGLSSGFPCVAIVATTTYVFFVQEQLIIMSFFFDPILLIALTTNMLLSVLVRGAIYVQSTAGAGLGSSHTWRSYWQGLQKERELRLLVVKTPVHCFMVFARKSLQKIL